MKLEVEAELVTIFTSFNQWVSRAHTYIGCFPKSEKIICLDINGNACNSGKDFQHANDHNLFPIKAYRLIKSREIKIR